MNVVAAWPEAPVVAVMLAAPFANVPLAPVAGAVNVTGRLIGTTTTYSFLPGHNFQNAYTYDAASNRTSLTAPDTSITTYGYDTLNRLNGMANSWAGSFGFSYDALNRRTQLTRPNGINTNYGYDAVSHLMSVLHQQGSTTLDGASYTYDAAGNRQTKTNYLNGVTSNYGYDFLYELTQVTQGGSTTESYSYDPAGNRLSSLGVPSYSYNSSNELTSSSNGSYTYDNNGNTLTDAAGRTFTWDFENRMVQAYVPGGGTTTFEYDPFGRRINKIAPGGLTNYLYDRKSIVQTVDGAGNVMTRLVGTQDVDEWLAETNAGTTSYYHQDGLRSVTSLSSTTASLSDTYVYDSFGKLQTSIVPVANFLQYTGREFDPESGLNYYRTRYYDSAIGRFTSEDLIRFKGGTNFYPYVNNRPVTFTDPMGTCLLQLVTSPNAHAEACGLEPKTNDRCGCLCAISPNFEGCMKDCKDGCLSVKLNPIEACQCLCNKGKENGTLNSFEAWLCKQGCKRNLK